MKPTQNKLNGERQQTTWHPLQVCLLSLLMAMGWAGFKQDVKAAAETNPVGTYALVSVNGNKLPYTVKHEQATMIIKSGAFVINADGTCISKMVFSVPPRADSSRDVKATYTHQGSKLSMKWEGAGKTVGTLEGDTFTMNNEGMIFVYRK